MYLFEECSEKTKKTIIWIYIKKDSRLWVLLYLSANMFLLFDSILGEVGASHKVGGWHAFFTCELHLIKVDVPILYRNF
jgi:hypothetical protein